MKRIAYKEGYRYQLVEDYQLAIDLRPPETVHARGIRLTAAGLLTIARGYAWDGPSGPTFHTLNFMRGSLVHDALYQLMRERRLDEEWRRRADEILRDICREDGMSAIRAWWVYAGVRVGGGPFAQPDVAQPVLRAPAVNQ